MVRPSPDAQPHAPMPCALALLPNAAPGAAPNDTTAVFTAGLVGCRGTGRPEGMRRVESSQGCDALATYSQRALTGAVSPARTASLWNDRFALECVAA